jgi:hypothetical protein
MSFILSASARFAVRGCPISIAWELSESYRKHFNAILMRVKADPISARWSTVRREPDHWYHLTLQKLLGVFSWRSAALRLTKQVSTFN